MAAPQSYPLYQAYVTNVRDFLLAETEIRRLINRAMKGGREQTVNVQTKVYALIYSTFAEANFIKMVLTPYGFDQPFIDQILHERNNLQQKWIKCLELAFQKFTATRKGSEVPNKVQELKRIILRYVIEPSIIRNKLAHGQISVATNSSNTVVNNEITDKINDLSFVNIMRLFYINQALCDIMEDLIESPDMAHRDNYYPKYQALETYIEKSEIWTNESKLQHGNMKKMIPSKKEKAIRQAAANNTATI
ncbi:hypothetical protein [Mucilaginibacter paludis]|uniref:Uncharacterized protein n=1 Tax=Mucilaginibacter paludis DSM 18603 TaxID=714943 RepID=H1YI51_9SPHI|nr:hypothetical protein [Mucilaginibacter paludis]EHQ26486.1 hypothetical protein Mucpa_2356 [Mucilaginibacter paludis DSM 18603]